jgi:hypothetical protein
MMFILATKLQMFKAPLRTQNTKHYGHISARAEKASLELRRLQHELHDHPDNTELQLKVNYQRTITGRILEAEILSQEEKHAYLNNSDKGTRMFHSIVKRI